MSLVYLHPESQDRAAEYRPSPLSLAATLLLASLAWALLYCLIYQLYHLLAALAGAIATVGVLYEGYAHGPR